MKCNKCGEYKETVADVRYCAGCGDGTNAQIPPLAHDDDAIGTIIIAGTGLANRFVPGSIAGEVVAKAEDLGKEAVAAVEAEAENLVAEGETPVTGEEAKVAAEIAGDAGAAPAAQ